MNIRSCMYVCGFELKKKKNYGGRGKYLDWCMYSVTQTWGEGGGSCHYRNFIYIS